MTVETDVQGNNDYENNPILSKLTLIAAGITIFFAVLSLIFSNRLETLRVEYKDTIQKGLTTEANAELNTIKQSMKAEMATTDKLRKKIAAITQESEKIKSDLALAQKTIAELRSAKMSVETMESSPLSGSPTSDSLPKALSPDPDNESNDLITEPEVQPPVQEPTDASSPEETVVPSSLPDEPESPSNTESTPPLSSTPSDDEIVTESGQAP